MRHQADVRRGVTSVTATGKAGGRAHGNGDRQMAGKIGTNCGTTSNSIQHPWPSALCKINRAVRKYLCSLHFQRNPCFFNLVESKPTRTRTGTTLRFSLLGILLRIIKTEFNEGRKATELDPRYAGWNNQFLFYKLMQHHFG